MEYGNYDATQYETPLEQHSTGYSWSFSSDEMMPSTQQPESSTPNNGNDSGAPAPPTNQELMSVPSGRWSIPNSSDLPIEFQGGSNETTIMPNRQYGRTSGEQPNQLSSSNAMSSRGSAQLPASEGILLSDTVATQQTTTASPQSGSTAEVIYVPRRAGTRPTSAPNSSQPLFDGMYPTERISMQESDPVEDGYARAQWPEVNEPDLEDGSSAFHARWVDSSNRESTRRRRDASSGRY
jgi:hypothetical protein